jgi:hypothetical protein
MKKLSSSGKENLWEGSQMRENPGKRHEREMNKRSQR